MYSKFWVDTIYYGNFDVIFVILILFQYFRFLNYYCGNIPNRNVSQNSSIPGLLIIYHFLINFCINWHRGNIFECWTSYFPILINNHKKLYFYNDNLRFWLDNIIWNDFPFLFLSYRFNLRLHLVGTFRVCAMRKFLSLFCWYIILIRKIIISRPTSRPFKWFLIINMQ